MGDEIGRNGECRAAAEERGRVAGGGIRQQLTKTEAERRKAYWWPVEPEGQQYGGVWLKKAGISCCHSHLPLASDRHTPAPSALLPLYLQPENRQYLPMTWRGGRKEAWRRRQALAGSMLWKQNGRGGGTVAPSE